MVKATRDDSLPFLILVISHHGKGLTGASLSIGKHCSIESFERVLHQRISTRLIYLNLRGLDSKDIIEHKVLGVGSFPDAQYIVLGLDAERRVHLSLPLVERPYS